MLLRSSEKRWSKPKNLKNSRAHIATTTFLHFIISKKIHAVIIRPRNRARGKKFEGGGNNRVSFHDKSRLPTLACNYRFKKVNRAEKRLVGEKNGYFRNRWRERAAYDHRFLRFLVKCFPCIADGNRWTRDSTRLDPDRPRAEQFISAVAAHAKWRRHE